MDDRNNFYQHSAYIIKTEIIMKKYFFLAGLVFAMMVLSSFQGFLKTSLEITIRDRLGNTVEGVKVKLYNTYDDFNNDIDFIGEPQQTDQKGRVLFKDLQAKAYYISAVKGDDNNYGDGEMVDTLIENRKNKVTIIIR
jgi:hypothetical protein